MEYVDSRHRSKLENGSCISDCLYTLWWYSCPYNVIWTLKQKIGYFKYIFNIAKFIVIVHYLINIRSYKRIIDEGNKTSPEYLTNSPLKIFLQIDAFAYPHVTYLNLCDVNTTNNIVEGQKITLVLFVCRCETISRSILSFRLALFVFNHSHDWFPELVEKGLNFLPAYLHS